MAAKGSRSAGRQGMAITSARLPGVRLPTSAASPSAVGGVGGRHRQPRCRFDLRELPRGEAHLREQVEVGIRRSAVGAEHDPHARGEQRGAAGKAHVGNRRASAGSRRRSSSRACLPSNSISLGRKIVAVNHQRPRRGGELSQVIERSRPAWNRVGVPHAALVEQIAKWPVARRRAARSSSRDSARCIATGARCSTASATIRSSSRG